MRARVDVTRHRQILRIGALFGCRELVDGSWTITITVTMTMTRANGKDGVCRSAWLAGRDVVIHPEHIIRVVDPLDAHQMVIVVTVDPAYRVIDLHTKTAEVGIGRPG
jgi:hypothetical protein